MSVVSADKLLLLPPDLFFFFFLQWFLMFLLVSCVEGWGRWVRMGVAGRLGSSISLRYPNIYPLMHINPCSAAAFWVKNATFLGRYSSSGQCLSTATHWDLSSAVTLHNNTHKFQTVGVCVCVCPWKSLESSIWGLCSSWESLGETPSSCFLKQKKQQNSLTERF